MRRLGLVVVLGLVAVGVAPAQAQAPAPAPPATRDYNAPAQAIHGRLLDEAGRPLANAPVIITENRGIAVAIVGAFAAVMTLGLSCLAGIDPCRSSGSVPTQTDAAGRFHFTAAQVNAARKLSHGVILAAGDLMTQGALTAKIDPTAGGDVDDLALWNPGTAVTDTNDGRRVRWNAPPNANGQTELHATIAGRTGGQQTNSWPSTGIANLEDKGVRGDQVVDPRAIEDVDVSLWLSAGFSRPRANQSPRIDWAAPPVKINGAGAPLSRGAPCTLTPGATTASRCRLTDGDLQTVVAGPCPDPNPLPTRPPPPPSDISRSPSVATLPMTPECANPPSAATIDLGQPTDIGLVAVRTYATTVSVSRDGAQWVPLEKATERGAWPAELWDVTGSWRYVKVEVPRPGAFNLAEVSIWPAKTSARQPAGAVAAAPSAPADDKGGPNAWLVVLGIVALAGGFGAAGIAVGRRVGRSR